MASTQILLSFAFFILLNTTVAFVPPSVQKSPLSKLSTSTKTNDAITEGMNISEDQRKKELSLLDLTLFTERQMTIFGDNTRILSERRYAKRRPYYPANLTKPPTIFDMSPPRSLTSDDPERYWLQLPYRATVVLVSFFSFPLLLEMLQPLVDKSSLDQIQQVIDSFVPGISILFGTLCSLTASILYQRQNRLQQTCSEEAALLSQTTQQLLHLLYREEHYALAKNSASAVADYIATLVADSRGREIMLIAVNDPINRFNEAVHEYEIWSDERGKSSGRVSNLLTNFADLSCLRARRLSDEAIILPPTHFFILLILSSLILAGFLLVCLTGE